jgi:hypothetical protein
MLYAFQFKRRVIRMQIKLTSLFLTIAVGAALTPYSQAFGKDGSKNANSNGAAHSQSAAASGNGQGETASNLGALNAGHAAPQAFVNAAPNARVGKIKAYFLASQAAAQTDAAALQTALEGSAPAPVVDAYKALQADPANPALQAAYDQAVADAALTEDQEATLAGAYSAWQEAVAADAAAASALDAAANKTPVSLETKAALDSLVAGSIY